MDEYYRRVWSDSFFSESRAHIANHETLEGRPCVCTTEINRQEIRKSDWRNETTFECGIPGIVFEFEHISYHINKMIISWDKICRLFTFYCCSLAKSCPSWFTFIFHKFYFPSDSILQPVWTPGLGCQKGGNGFVNEKAFKNWVCWFYTFRMIASSWWGFHRLKAFSKFPN